MKKGTISAGILCVGALIGQAVINRKKEEKIEKKVCKFKKYYAVLNEWLSMNHRGDSIANHLQIRNYDTIIIYGMGELGSRLYEELENSEIKIEYVVDKNADMVSYDVKAINQITDVDGVDAIIITAVYDIEEIKKNINIEKDIPIVSLEDLVFEM